MMSLHNNDKNFRTLILERVTRYEYYLQVWEGG